MENKQGLRPTSLNKKIATTCISFFSVPVLAQISYLFGFASVSLVVYPVLYKICYQ